MPIVNVADSPREDAPTYQSLIADAETAGDPFIDSVTPAGHFGVTVKNVGGVQTYWLKGDLADPAARVVARTQWRGMSESGLHYLRPGIMGGTLTSLLAG